MKKVLFLIHDLGQGGAEKVLVNLVNNMDRNRFDITVISLFGGGVNEQYLNEDIKYKTIFKKNIPGNMKLFSPRMLHRLFIKDRYDIEISYLEGPSARIISGCQNNDTKLITWIHVEQHTKELASKAFRSYEESVDCYQKFKHIVYVSESVKEDFESIYPMLKPGDVLYNTNETDQILKLKDTYWALILPICCSSFYCIIMRTFFQTTVPDAIIESAKIDGARMIRIFVQIVLPISLPAIATIGLFLTFAYWNDWMMAKYYISGNKHNLFPLQYVLIALEENISFLTRNSQNMTAGTASNVPSETVRMAMVVVSVVPIACSYPFFQKYFVSGLTIGAVKG